MASEKRLHILKDRAHMLRQARSFFYERNILEVDCPILSARAALDTHIDLIKTTQNLFLHSSPEHGMKRLLSEGIGDIYQLSHVFREGEQGHKHNPEFMMAEWYRIGISFEEMMEETADFIRVLLGDLPATIGTYHETFLKYTGIDYDKASIGDLHSYCMEKEINLYEGIEKEGKDAYLNIIFTHAIEPHLGNEELFILAYYPATQAALAKRVLLNGIEVAERFEIYYKSLELANGYHELTNHQEQRQRFNEANAQRIQNGKEPLPIDENLLEALKKGVPECCGVAVGFDRLMMLRHNVKDISEVFTFTCKTA